MGPQPQETGRSVPPPEHRQTHRGPLRLLARTLGKSWDDNIFSESAAAAFWQTLSLPPLLLGLLGSLGFLADWFGPAVVESVEHNILAFSRTVFTPNVVDQIIAPTVGDILTKAHSEIVSTGFIISLWAGSSALASLVDSITVAYNQYLVRHSVWQRIFALLLYVVGLIVAVVGLPIIALGPELLPTLLPMPWQHTATTLIQWIYYPGTGVLLVVTLATLYKVALPRKLPWHRGLPGALLAMAVFLLSSIGLRLYVTWVTSTGYTYGALATPIVFLLFAFFIGLAIISGAEFNNGIQEMWPARMTRRERRRWRKLEMQRASQRIRTEQGYQAWRIDHRGRSSPGPEPRENGSGAARESTAAKESPEHGRST